MDYGFEIGGSIGMDFYPAARFTNSAARGGVAATVRVGTVRASPDRETTLRFVERMT